MAGLEPLFTTVITGVGGLFAGTVLQYFNFFRKNKVEDRTSESLRLDAENIRAAKRADDAEADTATAKAEASRWYAELMVSQGDLLHEREYVSVLRKQLRDEGHEPKNPPTRLKGR